MSVAHGWYRVRMVAMGPAMSRHHAPVIVAAMMWSTCYARPNLAPQVVQGVYGLSNNMGAVWRQRTPERSWIDLLQVFPEHKL